MTQEKTEKPTEQKLKKGREEGQTASRKNVLEAITVIGGILLMYSFYPGIFASLSELATLVFDDHPVDLSERAGPIRRALLSAFSYVWILSVALAVAGVFFQFLMNDFNFAPKSMQPKFEKFNPIMGLKGIFNMATVYNFGRMLIMFTCTCLIFFFVIRASFVDIVYATTCGLQCIAEVFLNSAILIFIFLSIVLIILAYADFKLQNLMHIKNSKMTKDEVKREYFQNEGNPYIKGARKQIAHEDAVLPGMDDVTHVVYSSGFLVAIEDDEGYYPFVVLKNNGKGIGLLVTKLKEKGAFCVNLPDVAREFYGLAVVGRYMDSRCTQGLEQIKQRENEIKSK